MSSTLAGIALFLGGNLLGGAIVAALLLRLNGWLRMPVWPLVILGFGMAPLLIALVLFYVLLLLPGLSPAVVKAVVLLVFAGMAWAAGNGWSRLSAAILLFPATWRKEKGIAWLIAGSIGLMVVSLAVLTLKPLVDHDVLEYGVHGKGLLRQMAIHFQRHPYDPATGFYYVGLHAWGFPLLFTWEGLWTGGDLWVRAQTGWYALLLVWLVWGLGRKLDARWPLVMVVALVVPMSFLYLVSIYHLDALRIFFLTASVGAFVQAIRQPAWGSFLLLGVTCGLHAFLHSLGFIIGPMLCLVLLGFAEDTFKARLGEVTLAGLVLLLAGGIHYPLDIFFGTGWLLQDIIWY